MAKLSNHFHNVTQVARAYCDLSAQHLCKALQVENTPAMYLIEKRHIYAYNRSTQGVFNFDNVKKFLSEKPYQASSFKPLSSNIE